MCASIFACFWCLKQNEKLGWQVELHKEPNSSSNYWDMFQPWIKIADGFEVKFWISSVGASNVKNRNVFFCEASNRFCFNFRGGYYTKLSVYQFFTQFIFNSSTTFVFYLCLWYQSSFLGAVFWQKFDGCRRSCFQHNIKYFMIRTVRKRRLLQNVGHY